MVVTRTLVDAADPAFADPVKPIGRYFSEEEAARFERFGETWRRFDKGWRRVVASPEPLEILDAAGRGRAAWTSGFTVVAAGGGGVPVVREPDGTLRGVEAVIDKDLAAAVLARDVEATTLVIATNVPHAFVGYGTPRQRPDRAGDARRSCGRCRPRGTSPRGSMGPKVEAAAAVRRERRGARRDHLAGADRRRRSTARPAPWCGRSRGWDCERMTKG